VGADRLGSRSRGCLVSLFSSVDAAPDPSALIAYLDNTARAAWRMKQYATAAHALCEPVGLVLDLGCGAGHDLRLLAGVGLAPVGLDPSAVLLSEARRRGATAPLVRAVGESLPFADRELAGCRIERVLIHVDDPSAVLAEVGRCLRNLALLTVFEPDWTSFRVRGERGDQVTTWIAGVRGRELGAALWRLIEEAGFEVLDRVEEMSVWRALDVLDRAIGVDASVQRAIAEHRIDGDEARAWLKEQRDRDARGLFYAMMPKVMIVARRRETPDPITNG
jgi:SAM-dependent methyltransferase